MVAGHSDFVFVFFLRNRMFEQLRREFDFHANLPKIPIVHINLFSHKCDLVLIFPHFANVFRNPIKIFLARVIII